MAISPDLLKRSWAQKSDAMKFIRNNSIDLEGHEVARRPDGRYAVLPIEPKEDDVPLSPSQIEVAGDGTVTVGSAVAGQDDAARDAAEADAVAEAEAEVMIEPDSEAEARPEAEPGATGESAKRPMPARVILQVEEALGGDVAEMWAHTYAKRTKETIIIRDAETFEVVMKVAPGGGRAPKAPSQPRKKRASGSTGQRGAATQAIIAAMKEPGGKTLEDIGKAAGWVNKPSKFHLERIGKGAGFRVDITTRDGRKYYSAVFPDAAVAA